jgi:hypothetical protein
VKEKSADFVVLGGRFHKRPFAKGVKPTTYNSSDIMKAVQKWAKAFRGTIDLMSSGPIWRPSWPWTR